MKSQMICAQHSVGVEVSHTKFQWEVDPYASGKGSDSYRLYLNYFRSGLFEKEFLYSRYVIGLDARTNRYGSAKYMEYYYGWGIHNLNRLSFNAEFLVGLSHPIVINDFYDFFFAVEPPKAKPMILTGQFKIGVDFRLFSNIRIGTGFNVLHDLSYRCSYIYLRKGFKETANFRQESFIVPLYFIFNIK